MGVGSWESAVASGDSTRQLAAMVSIAIQNSPPSRGLAGPLLCHRNGIILL